MKRRELNMIFLYPDAAAAGKGLRELTAFSRGMGLVHERHIGDHGRSIEVVVLPGLDGKGNDFDAFTKDTMVVLRHEDGYRDVGEVQAIIDVFKKMWLASGAYAAYIDFEYLPGLDNRTSIVDEGPSPSHLEALERNRTYDEESSKGREPTVMPVSIVPGEGRIRRFDPSVATVEKFNLVNAFSTLFVSRFGRKEVIQAGSKVGKVEELEDGSLMVISKECSGGG